MKVKFRIVEELKLVCGLKVDNFLNADKVY